MKAFLSLVLLSVFVAAPAFAQEKAGLIDFAITAQYVMPADDEDYDFGFGVEGQIRSWINDNVGLSFAFGVANWEMNDFEAFVSEGSTTVGVALEGAAILFPIGVSTHVRLPLMDNLAITLEAGLRYVIVASDAEAGFVAIDGRGNAVYGVADLEFDDGFIGLVGVNIEAELAPGLSLLVGGGYQFDIAKGNVKWMGEDLGENELEAAFLRVGLSMNF